MKVVLIAKYGMITCSMGVGLDKGLEMLKSMGSPLSANVHRLSSDDPLPEIEPGTCPYPK